MTSTQLTNEDVKKLADLAKIEITDLEAESYKKDINNILGHLSMVSDTVISGGPTSGNAEKFYNYTREDNLDDNSGLRDFDPQIIFDNIPAKSKDNQVKVSKVIQK